MRRSRRSPRRSAMPRRAPSPAPFAPGRGARPPNGAQAGSAVEGGDVHREGDGAQGGDIAQILGGLEPYLARHDEGALLRRAVDDVARSEVNTSDLPSIMR